MNPGFRRKKSKVKRVPPDASKLDVLCRHHGVLLTPHQLEKLWAFHQLLRLRNRELNMTRIYNFENMVVKHYVDSMIVAQKIDLPSPLLDIGTGAGFPGIPLKIIRPDLHILLAEGRKKRVAFLQEALTLLEFEGIEIVGRKIDPTFDCAVGGVITRALEPVPDTLERIKTCLKPGGVAIFMKGPRCEPEISEAEAKQSHAYEMITEVNYKIPQTTHDRKLLVFYKREGLRVKKEPPFKGRILNITSPLNKTYISFTKLFSARGIRKTGRAILHGSRVVEEALKDHPQLSRGWISQPDHPHPPPYAPESLVCYRLTPSLFRELDLFGTKGPLLLIDMPPMAAWKESENWPEGCTLLIPFQDPENVGSVIRSAAAFGVSRGVLLKEAAHPFLPKACRAAGTGLLKIPLFSGPSIEKLPLNKPRLLALSTGGKDLHRYQFPNSFGLLAGLEGTGLPKRFRTEDNLFIPMKPGSESLNAAAAVSVALFAWRAQTRIS